MKLNNDVKGEYVLRGILLLLLLPLSYPITVTSMIPYVDPQIGENMWGLVAREGDAIDYLLDKSVEITATLNNTYDLVVDIDNTVDLLLAQSAEITATLDNTYNLAVTINDTVNDCCECDYFIEQTDIPITLTASGHYCVIEDLTATGTLITIAGNNILLDLQDHRVQSSNGDAILIRSGSIIRVIDGTVVGANGAGINAGVSGSIPTNMLIENVVATGCLEGFLASQFASGIRYKDCVAASNNANGFYHDARPLANHAYEQCRSFSNRLNGFFWDNSSGDTRASLNVVECSAVGNSGRGFLFERFNGLVITDSQANSNLSPGFESNSANGGLIQNCTALRNATGFLLASGTTNVSIMGSKALNNVIGFQESGSSTSLTGRNRLFNNYSKRNSSTNYLISGTSQAIIIVPTDLIITNSSNISWWVNVDGGA